MPKDYDCLKNKDIYSILAGDVVITKHEGEKYCMPYHTVASLMHICDLFSCPVQSGVSRWVYVEQLIETAIEKDCVDDLLQYFFSMERFSTELKSLEPDKIKEVYNLITEAAIKKINLTLYFSNHELKRIKEHFFVTACGSASIVDSPQTKSYDIPYVHSLMERCTEDFIAKNYDSVITKSRTLIEEVLLYVLEQKNIECQPNWSITQKLSAVKKELHLQQDSTYDKRVNSMVSGLDKIIQAIVEMRNSNSDAHGAGIKRINIKEPEARLVMNSAMTICEYIISVYDRNSNAKKN